MKNALGPIVEIAINVDREIADEFDAWLAHHIDEMLQISGLSRAEVFEQDDDDQGRARRITRYHFVSDTDLEHYLSGPAEAMRQSAIDRFEGMVEAVRRVLRHTNVAAGELHPLEVCPNCDTTLVGQYCGNCGQRATSRLISVWELFRDAFGDLLELDSRLWRTLIPLIIRPGQLTCDYLEGRRARFMPPFRMYLVLSIVFFLVAFFDPREELRFLYEPQAPSAAESEEDSNKADDIRAEIIRDLADEGIIIDQPGSTDVASNTESEDGDDGDSDTNCDVDDINSADLPDWLASRLTEERLNLMCDRIIADDGKAFGKKLLENVPAALFVLLPLMALVLKILYPLSNRYYVEHLLFVVHNHSFIFLILILQILFTRLGALLRVPEIPIDVIVFAVSLYVPVYLYKSLRRVYAQGWFFTIVKFSMLGFAYFSGLMLMFGLVALFAAFAI